MCGWETSGPEDLVVEATAEHGRRMHNMIPTRDEVLAMVIRPDRPGDSLAESNDRQRGSVG